ncbi:unnamed protein product [Cylindrotheca closterium]|uniref:Uncharacterized protein n=1 Tax=Cylindrotheca closterium TaxID=2856 RepID=A0AAD2CKB3_9STRA|nr:unnamed protein product [Cylindrotheca closterium]
MKFSLNTMKILFSLVSILSTVVHQVGAEQDCETECSSVYYKDKEILRGLCINGCSTMPEMFNAEFPYLLGPLTMQAYPELTNSDPEELKDMTGTLFARVHVNRTKMQFSLSMDTNPTPFFPYFA